MNQSALTQAHQYFTCLTELRRDAGELVRSSRIRRVVIKEADRRAEWSAEHQREIYYQKIRELLDKLHGLPGTKLTASIKQEWMNFASWLRTQACCCPIRCPIRGKSFLICQRFQQ